MDKGIFWLRPIFYRYVKYEDPADLHSQGQGRITFISWKDPGLKELIGGLGFTEQDRNTFISWKDPV